MTDFFCSGATSGDCIKWQDFLCHMSGLELRSVHATPNQAYLR